MHARNVGARGFPVKPPRAYRFGGLTNGPPDAEFDALVFLDATFERWSLTIRLWINCGCDDCGAV